MLPKQVFGIAAFGVIAAAQVENPSSTVATVTTSSSAAAASIATTTTSSSSVPPGGGSTTITALIADGVSTAGIFDADACISTIVFNCENKAAKNQYCSEILRLSYAFSGVLITVTASARGGAFSAAFGEGSTEVNVISVGCTLSSTTSPTESTFQVCATASTQTLHGSSHSNTQTVLWAGAYTPSPVTITGGANHLAAITTSCTSIPNAAPTAIAEVYKILVPVGAALAAGAAIL